MLALANRISCHASVMAVQLQNALYHHRPLTKVNNHMNLNRFHFSWVLKKLLLVPIIVSLNNKRLPASLNNQMKKKCYGQNSQLCYLFHYSSESGMSGPGADGLGHLQTMK